MSFYSILILLATFLSGFTALVYQVCFQKYLAFLVGSEARSIALVVAVFLAGLALGYFFWGKLTRQVFTRQRLLKAYALIELGIGCYAIFFPYFFPVIRNIAYAGPHAFYFDLMTAIAALIVPTFLMGGTIPILTSVISDKSDRVNDNHYAIYGVNTLGAFLGTLLAATLVIPWLGLAKGLATMGVINVLIALFFYFNKLTGEAHKTNKIPQIPNRLGNRVIFICSLILGAVSIGLEVLLVRALGLAIGMSYLVFPLVLAVFILGLGLGSLSLYNKKLEVSHYLNAIAWALLLNSLVFVLIPYWPYWFNHIRVSLALIPSNYYLFHILVFLVLSCLLLPGIIFLGKLLPMSYGLLNKDGQNYGHACGKLYFFNTIGTVIGAIVLGYLFLYWFEMDTLLKLLLLFMVCILMLCLYKERKRFGLYWVTVIVVLVLMPVQWNRADHANGLFRIRTVKDFHFKGLFHQPQKGLDIRFFEDGPNTTVSVAAIDRDNLSIFVNGKSDGNNKGYRDLSTMRLLAYLPFLFLNEDDLNVTVIGQGTGTTAGTLAALPEVKRVDVLEISPAVVEASRHFKTVNKGLHNNPKVHFHVVDAFKYFSRPNEMASKPQIIVSEPSNPWVVGVENLYTNEFYTLVTDSLSDNGIFVQWLHQTEMDLEPFQTVIANLMTHFKHVRMFRANASDVIFLASNSSLPLSVNQAHYDQPLVQQDLKEIGLLTPEMIEFQEYADNRTLANVVKNSSKLIHNLNHPTLATNVYRAWFLDKSVHLDNLFKRHYIRQDDQQEMKRRQALFERARDSLKRQGWTVDDIKELKGTYYVFLDSQFRCYVDSQRSFKERLKCYSVLRDERLIPKDPGFLNALTKQLQKDTPHSARDAHALIYELVKEGDIKTSFEIAEQFQKKGIIKPKQLLDFVEFVRIVKKKNDLI